MSEVMSIQDKWKWFESKNKGFIFSNVNRKDNVRF